MRLSFCPAASWNPMTVFLMLSSVSNPHSSSPVLLLLCTPAPPPLKAFATEFLSCCHLECLIMGNATAAEARQLCGDVADILNTCTPPAGAANGAASSSSSSSSSSKLVLAAADRPVEVCVQLPEGLEVLLVEPARNPDEDNCAVEVYYQVNL